MRPSAPTPLPSCPVTRSGGGNVPFPKRVLAPLAVGGGGGPATTTSEAEAGHQRMGGTSMGNAPHKLPQCNMHANSQGTRGVKAAMMSISLGPAMRTSYHVTATTKGAAPCKHLARPNRQRPPPQLSSHVANGKCWGCSTRREAAGGGDPMLPVADESRSHAS